MFGADDLGYRPGFHDDLDQIGHADVEDVAECRQDPGVQPLGGTGDQPVDLPPRQHHAAFSQRPHQVARGEHPLGGHDLSQVPLDRRPPSAHRAPPCTPGAVNARSSAFASVRFLKSSETLVYKAVVAAYAWPTCSDTNRSGKPSSIRWVPYEWRSACRSSSSGRPTACRYAAIRSLSARPDSRLPRSVGHI